MSVYWRIDAFKFRANHHDFKVCFGIFGTARSVYIQVQVAKEDEYEIRKNSSCVSYDHRKRDCIHSTLHFSCKKDILLTLDVCKIRSILRDVSVPVPFLVFS
jgi:hypothetical protein